MGNTQKAIQKKQIRPSTSTKTESSITNVEKKPSIVNTANVKAPALLQKLHIRQHDHLSLDEAIYMAEDLYCIDDGEKLKEPLHRSIGALTFKNAYNYRGFGSGILISQDAILTAAHNIYQRLIKQKNKEFRFYIGANGETQDFYQIQSWKYPEEYQTCNQNVSREYDYAIMKLKKPVVHFKQFLPLKIPCSICLLKDNSKVLKIYGFPATYQIRPNEQPKIYKDNFKVLSQDGKKINLFQYGLARSDRIRFFNIIDKKIGYQMSTLPGQSGSPVTIDNCIIAIHLGNGNRKQFNQGRIIDKNLLKSLQRWGNSLRTQSFRIIENKQCDHLPLIMGTFTLTDRASVQRSGLGIVIAKNLVLTAAHNLFDRVNQENYKNIRFYLGSTIKLGERFFQIASFQHPDQYKTCDYYYESMYDYALVKLQGEVHFDKFMKISPPCHQCIQRDMKNCLDIYGLPQYCCDNGQIISNLNHSTNKEGKMHLLPQKIYHVEKIFRIGFFKDQMECLIKDFDGTNVGAPLILNNQIIGTISVKNKYDYYDIVRLFDRQFANNIQAWSKSMNNQQYNCIQYKCSHMMYFKLKQIAGYKKNKMIHRSICAVRFLCKYSRPYVATGVLLSKDIVLTVAQTCYISDYECQSTYIEVRFEQKNGISKSYYEIQSFRYLQQYKTCRIIKKLDYDYALLKLKRPVNYDLFPKISLPCHKCILKSSTFTYSQIVGFPLRQNNWKGAQNFKIQKNYQLVQFSSGGKGTVNISKQNQLNHLLQTDSGMAGSPIFFKNRMIAVHTGVKPKSQQRVARLITPDLIVNIKKWCAELKGEPFQVLDEDHICQ